MRKIILKPETSNKKRLDLALCQELPEYSRSQVLAMIKSGEISRVDREKIKPSRPIEKTTEFLLNIQAPKGPNLVAEDIPLDILFHDEHLAIINKPVGMVVHPGAGVMSHTLCHALLHYFPTMAIGDTNRPGIVHRLDKNTSGVMVVAKTHLAHRLLSDMFKARTVQKIYLAYCFGEIKEAAFELKTGHARHPHNRLKFFTRLSPPELPSDKVRFAHTSIQVLRRGFGISLVKATLHTGRTHQIRAHLADIGHGLLGDDLYAGRRSPVKAIPERLAHAIINLPGQALHAESLAFEHPITKELLNFSAPLPQKLLLIEEILQSC